MRTGREEWTLKITDVRTAVVEATYDWTFTRIYTDKKVTGFGESFLAPGLSQGEIYHGC
jgi:L-alanine-DL-glutamate epimerase-like enolase superfamily enzyme